MSQPPNPRTERCPACRLFLEVCLCQEIPRIETHLEFVIVRHHSEAHKNSNTGRLVDLALPRCCILDFGGKDQVLDEGLLRGPAWLLFLPERDHQGRETGRHEVLTGTDVEPPGRVVVLDGTWGQTRRMSHRIDALDRLPRYLLPPVEAPPERLRRMHRPEAMSTIEAVARFLELFEAPEKARRLDELYAKFVRRHKAMGRRTRRGS